MRAIKAENRPLIEVGMNAATNRLVHGANSPLLMGATVGLVHIIDGPEEGMHFVTDVQRSADYDETGFPKELWLAYAEYLESMAESIRSGAFDSMLKPLEEVAPCDGSA